MQAKITLIANSRSKIDKFDDKILHLIRLRFREVQNLKALKGKIKLGIIDKKREKQILAKTKNKYEQAIFKKIITQSRKMQKGL